nr:hypothetical protein [Tanacetum cinerariifolium]
MDDLESDDELVDTLLVSPFLDSGDDSDDGEVLNELEEYGNAGRLCRKKGYASWNSIPPIHVLSKIDLMNGYKYSHEKNKLMYKNCLNLGLEYQVDKDMKEWVIRGM